MVYKLDGKDIDTEGLYSKDYILECLEGLGADDSTLALIREAYQDKFGNELMWRYPISDGYNAAAFIVCCKEGFLSLPYNHMDAEVYEILDLEKASMHDTDSMQYFIDDWKLFSDNLLAVMTDMLHILEPKD